jgi:PAS domain S-box-containing protein
MNGAAQETLRRGPDEHLRRRRRPPLTLSGRDPDVVLRQLMLGEALDLAGYAVLVADDGMRYLEASTGACRLLEYSREELLALTVPQVVVETRAERLYAGMVDDGAQHGTITLRTKSGRVVPARYDARRTSVGGLTYYVSLLTPLPSED